MLDGLNRYTYCHNNPIIYTDPTGNVVETITDVISTALGVMNTYFRFRDGDILGGILSGIATTADGIATFIPGLPGGVTLVAKTVSQGAVLADGVKNVITGIKDKNDLLTAIGAIQLISSVIGVGSDHYKKLANDSFKRMAITPHPQATRAMLEGIHEEDMQIFLKIIQMFGVSASTFINTAKDKSAYSEEEKTLLDLLKKSRDLYMIDIEINDNGTITGEILDSSGEDSPGILTTIDEDELAD